MHVNEEQLVRRMIEGDRDAFDILSASCRPLIAAICRRYFPNCADAEDAAQEVILRAWQKRESFRGDCRFTSWLIPLANRVCINLLRERKQIHLSLDDESQRAVAEVSASRPSPENQVLARAVVQAVLARLNERERLIFKFTYQLGMSSEEIAAQLPREWGLTASGVRTVIHRKIKPAIEAVRKEIDSDVK